MDIDTILDKKNSSKYQELLHKELSKDFIGLDTQYTVVSRQSIKSTYLDSTASTLMMGGAYRVASEFLKHYSNTHSVMHFSAKIATKT